MAKEVTVLGIEDKFLRGVRLEERNGSFTCADVASWPLVDESAEAASETTDASGEETLGAPIPDDAPVITAASYRASSRAIFPPKNSAFFFIFLLIISADFPTFPNVGAFFKFPPNIEADCGGD